LAAAADARRRVEPVTPQRAPTYRLIEKRKQQTPLGALRAHLEHNLLLISSVLLLVGLSGWCFALYSEFRASGLIGGGSSTYAETLFDAGTPKSDPAGTSVHARGEPWTVASIAPAGAAPDGASPASIVSHEWSFFEPRRTADVGRAPTPAAPPAKPRPPVHTASLGPPPPAPAPQTLAYAPNATPAPPTPPRVLANIGPKTSLVDFETAPFPYQGERGHGRRSQTYSDDHVLLHIPQGFDPSRPAVMVVFFHGHGAILARDIRDRQRLPEQISAAGLNAVLVAPQFAVNAADSSAGKFWEPDGFKRFLDEAANRLAMLYGDQRSSTAFANMPIVLVAYSGGFGPTLSVLARGGANSRIRGLVLLDALYSGVDQFADWIAANRSAFFISSYTPHIAHHNADLRRALTERSVAFSSELRPNHLQGMVTILPAGDVPHRDFVTHAWTDGPVEDVLLRMSDTVPRIGPTTVAAAARHD
jgi:hypothetical protein